MPMSTQGTCLITGTLRLFKTDDVSGFETKQALSKTDNGWWYTHMVGKFHLIWEGYSFSLPFSYPYPTNAWSEYNKQYHSHLTPP